MAKSELRRLENSLQSLVQHATSLAAVLEVLVVVVLGESGEKGQLDTRRLIQKSGSLGVVDEAGHVHGSRLFPLGALDELPASEHDNEEDWGEAVSADVSARPCRPKPTVLTS